MTAAALRYTTTYRRNALRGWWWKATVEHDAQHHVTIASGRARTFREASTAAHDALANATEGRPA